MTITTEPTTFDPTSSANQYKDIHKAIRAELFGVTHRAGSIDPADATGLTALAERVGALVGLLVSHAEHEDTFVQPLIERHVPSLAGVVTDDHATLDARMLELVALADSAALSGGRPAMYDLYLELASFTGDYLTHQDLEERRIMPALLRAVSVEELVEVHRALVASVPPDEMAGALGLMIPALNVEDRVDLLSGMQLGAPPEVFAGVCALAQSVLDTDSWSAVAHRLGVA